MLLLMMACAKHVAWDIQPVSTLPVGASPDGTLLVTVVSADKSCTSVARELEETLKARPGVRVVTPSEARIRLSVGECSQQVLPSVIVDSQDVSVLVDDTVHFERRRYELYGSAGAQLLVEADGVRTVLEGSADRQDASGWLSPSDFALPSMMEFESALKRDLAWDLADQLAPLPETVRRMVYVDPEPGTSRMLHNQAVEAERAGDLDEALRLAKEAYAANPSATSRAYLEEIEAHAHAIGYAFKME